MDVLGVSWMDHRVYPPHNGLGLVPWVLKMNQLQESLHVVKSGPTSQAHSQSTAKSTVEAKSTAKCTVKAHEARGLGLEIYYQEKYFWDC